MMPDIRAFIRPELRDLKPYVNLRQSHDLGILLDLNESPWDREDKSNRYHSDFSALTAQLATLYGIASDEILLTRGSDEGIDLLIRLFCRPYYDAILICPPTFSMYRFYAKLQGITVMETPGDCENIKILFLCSPNNPTGHTTAPDEIFELCQKLAEKAIVVVDEAYIEFSTTESMTSYIQRYPNLVVLRTLSKAFGLAGLRCGALIAHKQLVQYLRAVLAPYPFSTATIQAAMDATKPACVVALKERVRCILTQRKIMQTALTALCCVKKVWPSEANFLLVEFNDAKKIYATCLENGIRLRDVSNEPGLENCLRISIGLPEQNESLINVLRKCV